VRKRYSLRSTLIALVFATALIVWAVISMADGSVSIRNRVHHYPSFMFIFDAVLVGLAAMIVALAWARTIGKVLSGRREDG
jgi:hypothetical protein